MIAVILFVTVIMLIIFAIATATPDNKDLAGESSWILATLLHIPQFVIPFIIILYLTKGGIREYGFNLGQKPPVFTHKRMLGLGVLFGLLFSLHHIVRVASGNQPDIPQPINTVSVLGNLSFQWIIVGLSEETMFRGLIQTYLMKNLRGYLNLVGHDLHIGTVIGGILWGLFHFVNILVMPIGPVVFYVSLTTIAGLAMGYAYQETGSLLTTIIVHNSIFGTPLAIGYLLCWVF